MSTVTCSTCGHIFPPAAGQSSCPQCGGQDLRLSSSDGMTLIEDSDVVALVNALRPAGVTLDEFRELFERLKRLQVDGAGAVQAAALIAASRFVALDAWLKARSGSINALALATAVVFGILNHSDSPPTPPATPSPPPVVNIDIHNEVPSPEQLRTLVDETRRLLDGRKAEQDDDQE